MERRQSTGDVRLDVLNAYNRAAQLRADGLPPSDNEYQSRVMDLVILLSTTPGAIEALPIPKRQK